MPTLPKGFSLLELMVTVAITIIMIGIAVPVTGSFITTNRMATQVNQLRASLAQTRSEAITRNRDVVICKSADQEFCTRQGGWHQGWIIFVDHDRDRKRSQKEPLLSVNSALNSNIQLRYRAFGSRHYIVFYATGMSKTNGTFTFCGNTSPDRARALILTKTGRVRLSRARSDGRPLECG